MKNILALTVFVMAMLSPLAFTIEVAAIPGFTPTEYLIPNAMLSSDFHMADGNLNSQYTAVDGNPGASSDTFWETNNSYIYWGNLSSQYDETGDRGVGTAIFHLSEPLGISPTGYWRLSATTWMSFPTFAANWIDIGHVIQADASNAYHGYDLGIGYTSVNRGGTLVHSQYAHTAWSSSSWGVDGASADYWFRPDTGIQWWDVGNNSLESRAWSTSEMYNLVVIIQMKLENQLFLSTLIKNGGDPLALACCGLQVAIAPSPYTYTTTEAITVEVPSVMYYLVPILAVFAFSAASAFFNRNRGFIMNVFLASFIIGFSVLIWSEILPTYFIILPGLILVLMWMGKLERNDTDGAV